MALGNVNSADVIKVRGDDLFQLPVLIKDGGVPEIQKSVLKFYTERLQISNFSKAYRKKCIYSKKLFHIRKGNFIKRKQKSCVFHFTLFLLFLESKNHLSRYRTALNYYFISLLQ